ncbi:MAG: hypothetical protein ACJAT2_002071 [Bacteriovoracaceae bacterium]|jgi:hypothetical protein
MKLFLALMFLPLIAFSSEKAFMKEVNKKCANIGNEKEKSACVAGTFIDFCKNPTNQRFCNKEAALADYAKRTEGAKEGLKRIYKALLKSKKKNGSYEVDLREVFKQGKRESFFYYFGVPKTCQHLIAKNSPSNTLDLHGVYERVVLVEKKIEKEFEKMKCLKKGSFRFYAIGQVDDDPSFDIWYVDNKKRIKHFRSDLKR